MTRLLADVPRRKAVTMMGNKATTGPFAPLVVVVRGALGDKEFNLLRGKGISLHSQGELFVAVHLLYVYILVNQSQCLYCQR